MVTLGRRDFVASVLGGGAAALVAGVPADAAAQLGCVDGPMARFCEVGVLSDLMHVAAIRSGNTQVQSQWCWAACIEMVLGYHGHPISQARIVQEAYGRIVDMPAQPATIIRALNRTWIDDNGVQFKVTSNAGMTRLEEAAQDLAADFPLIVGSMGHAMVMSAMQYAFPIVAGPFGPAFGPAQLQGIEVRDPWPGKGHRSLSFQEIVSTMMVVRVRV